MPDAIGAVIVAAGSGTRMAGADKLFTKVAGRPLLAHAVDAFQECAAVDRIVLVLSEQNLERGWELVQRYRFAKVSAVCAGGERRQDSVRAGLAALGPCDYVAVHDGARPLVSPELIERGLKAAREMGAAAPAVPLADTVKEAGPDGIVMRTLDRSRLWAVQTPQVFRYDLLLRAHREVTAEVTDDAAMVEALGEPVRLFEGSRTNIKVTTAEDLELVQALRSKSEASPKNATILHITTLAKWEEALSAGVYRGDTLGSGGFIHCSTPNQVIDVANEWFRGRDGLVLLRIDPRQVKAEIRYEGVLGGELFPHIYGALNLDAVTSVSNLVPGEDGRFQLPAETGGA